MQRRWLGPVAGLALVFAACSDSGAGLEAVDLQGTWVASSYEYTDTSNPQNVVDVIPRDSASFTLTVDAAGNAATQFDDGQGSTSSDSGTLSSEGTSLTLAGRPFEAQRSGDLLTLSYADSSFDFGTGSTSATLRIVMHRQ